MLCLGPVQQVHLGGLLGGDAAPGPALVPEVMQRRGVLQLAGEVEAALQTCNDSQQSAEHSASQMGLFSPTPLLPEAGLQLL